MSQRMLIHGFHAIIARLRHHPESIQVIYLDQSRRDLLIQSSDNLSLDLMCLARACEVRLRTHDGYA